MLKRFEMAEIERCQSESAQDAFELTAFYRLSSDSARSSNTRCFRRYTCSSITNAMSAEGVFDQL